MFKKKKNKLVGISSISLPDKYIHEKVAFITTNENGIKVVDVIQDKYISFNLYYYPDTPADMRDYIVWSWEDGNARYDNFGEKDDPVKNTPFESFRIPPHMCGSVVYTILARLKGQPV